MGARRPRGLAAAALGLASFGLAALGAAAPVSETVETQRLSLRWSAPAGCPAAKRVAAEVNRLLGAGAPAGPPLVAAAEVRADPGGELRVRIVAEGEGGARVRELHAASCEALADATATILALMIDPNAEPLPPAAPPADAPPAAPTAQPSPAPRAEEPPPAPPPRPPLTPRFGLGAWGAGDVGSLPGAGLGVAGSAAVLLAAFRIELGGAFFPSRTASQAARPKFGGDVSLGLGSVAGCWDPLPSTRFELGPCLGYEIGRMYATGTGVTNPGEGEELWSAGRAGGLFAWVPIPRLAVLLRAEAAVPFTRRSFTLTNVGEVYRPGPVAGRAGLGVELRL